MFSLINDLVLWAGIHPIAFTVIWLLIGVIVLVVMEQVAEKELSLFYRAVIIAAWPCILVLTLITFILILFEII